MIELCLFPLNVLAFFLSFFLSFSPYHSSTTILLFIDFIFSSFSALDQTSFSLPVH